MEGARVINSNEIVEQKLERIRMVLPQVDLDEFQAVDFVEGSRLAGSGLYQLHVEAETFAKLIEAAVNRIAGFGSTSAASGTLAALGLALPCRRSRNNGKAVLGNGLLHKSGDISGKLGRSFWRIDGERQYQHTGRGGIGHACQSEKAEYQTSQTRKNFAHRALQISVQGCGPDWPQVPGYASL